MTDPVRHVPVLLEECIAALQPREGAVILDGTFGAGGYSSALLAAGARVIGVDRDPSAIAGGQALVDAAKGRLTLVEGRFGDLDGIARDSTAKLDGVVLDIGVSSMQLDEAGRGFSLRFDAPLDMRMEGKGRSAADILLECDEDEIADILFHYGEERASRRIARAIVNARERGALPTGTAALAALVARASGARGYWRIHPATRTFQALRIAVNDELDSLRRGLAAATERTRIGGRIAIISFHSLEDRIVKTTFRDDPRLHALTKKPILPSAEESARNPRARSAKLRGAERTA